VSAVEPRHILEDALASIDGAVALLTELGETRNANRLEIGRRHPLVRAALGNRGGLFRSKPPSGKWNTPSRARFVSRQRCCAKGET